MRVIVGAAGHILIEALLPDWMFDLLWRLDEAVYEYRHRWDAFKR